MNRMEEAHLFPLPALIAARICLPTNSPISPFEIRLSCCCASFSCRRYDNRTEAEAVESSSFE